MRKKKQIYFTIALLAVLISLSQPFASAADPEASIHSVKQLPGTKTVEIVYSATDADGDDLDVTINVESNGTSIASLSGNKGGNVTNTWNAGSAWNGNAAELTFTVVAEEDKYYNYILSGKDGKTDPLRAYDQVFIELNGDRIYTDPDIYAGDCPGTPLHFSAQTGDELRVIGYRKYSEFGMIDAFWLYRSDGLSSKLSEGSTNASPDTVFFDKTFELP